MIPGLSTLNSQLWFPSTYRLAQKPNLSKLNLTNPIPMKTTILICSLITGLALPWLAAAQTNAPVITVNPAALDFGTVGIGQTNRLVLTVKNVGAGTLVGQATVVQPPFSVLSGGSYSLAANQ